VPASYRVVSRLPGQVHRAVAGLGEGAAVGAGLARRVVASVTPSSLAASGSVEPVRKSSSRRVEETLDLFYAKSGQNRDLVEKEAAVMVLPSVTKAGAGVGGEYGEGELKVGSKTAGDYKVTGASIGATLGAARRSEVIVFKTAEARDKFISKKDWTIGADLGVAVGV